MLFFLTGDIQTGKTRWLQSVLCDLGERGVGAMGVIAPGVWREHSGRTPESGRFEKLGIDNVLLPRGEVVPFARRRDLAERAGVLQGALQSEAAQLHWAIDDAAIEAVNAHFRALGGETDGGNTDAGRDASMGPALLVVDELGRLELLHGGGLVDAVRLLDRGASPRFPHAIVVVRAGLLDAARERFAEAPWNGMHAIHPDDASRALLLSAFA